MDYKFYEVMNDIFDKNKAYQNVETIHNYEKWMSYDKFALGSAFCYDKMLEIGLDDVERREIIADGETFYGDHIVSRSWCAKSATLTLSTGEVICDYKSIPCSLSMYSNPTPPEGITAELTVIDDIKNVPDEMDLKGKLILVNTVSGGAIELAKEKGAIGILHDVFPLFSGVRDSRDEMKGVHRWDCMPDMGHELFAFSLAPEQGDMLREMCKKEKVILHAKVDAEFTDIPLYVVSGGITGTNPDAPEIILYGHLDEPGANDNASGCGGILELMRSMKLAINSGKLERPKNTIRAVMGPEYYGSMGYIYFHPERERLTLISADMIGNEAKDRAHIAVKHSPLSNRAYTDGAIILAHKRYDEFFKTEHYLERRYYTAGSDNYVADPSLNTPAVGMGNFPAQSYHSSADTMERIESDKLKQYSLIVGDFAYILATADTDTCDALKAELLLQGEDLLKNAKTLRRQKLCKESIAISINSLKRLVPDYDTDTVYEIYNEEMPDYALKMGADKVPIRLLKGPIFMLKYPEYRKYISEVPLQWTDGARNIWEITIHAAAEMEKDSDEDIKNLLEFNITMFEKLEKINYCLPQSDKQ